MSDKDQSGDGGKKRGPSDCLEDSEEEEFTPFTQSNPELFRHPAKKVFARKSSAKRPLARRKKVARKSSCSPDNYL